jgi:hypothetical protein
MNSILSLFRIPQSCDLPATVGGSDMNAILEWSHAIANSNYSDTSTAYSYLSVSVGDQISLLSFWVFYEAGPALVP